MERGCKKTTENIYLRCRKEAAKYNEALSSRERASEQLGISDASLRNYELGITKLIPADIILIMAELYNAPELPSHYCLNECPLSCSRTTSASCLSRTPCPSTSTPCRLAIWKSSFLAKPVPLASLCTILCPL